MIYSELCAQDASTWKELAFRFLQAAQLCEEDMPVVIDGGGGIRCREDFALLEELAALLQGKVYVSRTVADAGWRPFSDLIGLSGRKLTPSLYLGIGVSGSFQHMTGIRKTGYFAAVNTDPEAPILARADLAILMDYTEVLPPLIRAIKDIKMADSKI